MTALIICPVGCDLTFMDDVYDHQNHWRFTDASPRTYETLCVVYNDYTPDEKTYDHLLRMKGHKWQIIKNLVNNNIFDFSKYDYIGCVDDDLITDIQSFNTGLELAREKNFKLWQLSMVAGSGIIYNCLKQKSNITYSETNFIEMGSPFFRRDIFLRAIDFFNQLDFTIGWGIDKMFCDVLECSANVVHCASIYHPPTKVSYYDQRDAMAEMNHMIEEVYPKIMREKYGRTDWVFRDKQETLAVSHCPGDP